MAETLELTFAELGQLDSGLAFLIDDLREGIAYLVKESVRHPDFADFAVSAARRLRQAELLYRRLTSPPHYSMCVGADELLPAVYRTPPVHHLEEAA